MGIYFGTSFSGGSVVKKNPPANVEDVSQEDILEKEMETHSSNLAWEIPRTEEPGELQSHGVPESDRT